MQALVFAGHTFLYNGYEVYTRTLPDPMIPEPATIEYTGCWDIGCGCFPVRRDYSCVCQTSPPTFVRRSRLQTAFAIVFTLTTVAMCLFVVVVETQHKAFTYSPPIIITAVGGTVLGVVTKGLYGAIGSKGPAPTAPQPADNAV